MLSGDVYIPKNTTYIGDSAFANTSIKTIIFDSETNVETLNPQPFNNIQTITIPSSVTSILSGGYGFLNNNLNNRVLLFEEKTQEEISSMSNYDGWFKQTKYPLDNPPTIKWYKTQSDGSVLTGSYIYKRSFDN